MKRARIAAAEKVQKEEVQTEKVREHVEKIQEVKKAKEGIERGKGSLGEKKR